VLARYAAGVLLIAAVASAAAWSWRERFGPGGYRGTLLGAALATIGALAGMALTAWSFDKGQREFMTALAAGMLGRLAGFGGVLVYVALRTTIDPIATAAALLTLYVVFQILEIRMVLAGLARRQGRAGAR